MTNSSPNEPLGFDELIGIIVAFGVIGTILAFSILSGNGDAPIFEGVSPQQENTTQPNSPGTQP